MSRVWGNASGHPFCVVREMAEGKMDMDNLGNSEWFQELVVQECKRNNTER